MDPPSAPSSADDTTTPTPPAPPPPPTVTVTLPTKARIALVTVRSAAIAHAIPVIRARPDDAELVCVLTTPGPKNRRSTAHIQVVQALHDCGYSGVDVICSNSRSHWPNIFAAYNVNLLLVSGFPWLIPTTVLNDPRLSLGVINVHNSLLPEWAGPNAFGWYMATGSNYVGYTCHRMSAEFDTGPILFQETVTMDVNEDYQDLKIKVPPVFRSIVDRAITCALQGDPGTPQVGTPTAAPKFETSFRWVDPTTMTALTVHNRVRAYYGERDHPKGALYRLLMDDSAGTTVVVCLTKTRYRPPVTVDLGTALQKSENATSPTATNIDLDGAASLTSVTTHSSESLSTSPGTTSGSAALAGSSSTTTGPFWIQCCDTALEVLEWHLVNDDDPALVVQGVDQPLPLVTTTIGPTTTPEAAIVLVPPPPMVALAAPAP